MEINNINDIFNEINNNIKEYNNYVENKDWVNANDIRSFMLGMIKTLQLLDINKMGENIQKEFLCISKKVINICP